MNSRGICYVTWGQEHFQEAIRSAQHARELGYETCLICDFDMKENPKVYGFDYVKQIPDPLPFESPHPMFQKLLCYTESPFDVTCFLDSETVPLAKLDLGFELAEEGFFAACIAPHSTFTYKGREYVHYNGGVMFTRTPRTDIVKSVLKWAADAPYYLGDEIALSLALRHDILTAALPQSFNVCLAGQGKAVPIRVYHSMHHVGNPPRYINYDYFGNLHLSNWPITP